MVEHEFWDSSRDICVAHQRQRAIVKDQPLTIHASGDCSVIFVWEQVFQYDDLHIVLGNACLQQRGILDDCVVLTVTSTVSKCFKRIAPMVRSAPLHLVTD